MKRARIAATLALFLSAATASAQPRELQRYPLESAEGRLMGFYSSALASTAPGVPFSHGTAAFSLELALDLAYIPHLTARQRSAGFDKPEASNLSPFLLRPRVVLALPGNFVMEGSWLPPVRVMDAQAILYGVSLQHNVIGAWGGIDLASRLAFSDGRAEGAITCNEGLGGGSLSDQLYYANVCHAQPSNDYFRPRQLSVDFTLSSRPSWLSGIAYASVGARREWAQFDIGVIQNDGTRDLDHPILEMSATRAFGALGLQWGGGVSAAGGRMRRAIEVFYTPGSLATVRLLAGWRVK